LGPSRKVVSSPPEKIWKYFPINLFTLNKIREREKAQRRFTRYDNCISTAKNTSSAAMCYCHSLLGESRAAVLFRRDASIDWLMRIGSRKVSTIKFHSEMYRDGCKYLAPIAIGSYI
jgi:hypothetical protein